MSPHTVESSVFWGTLVSLCSQWGAGACRRGLSGLHQPLRSTCLPPRLGVLLPRVTWNVAPCSLALSSGRRRPLRVPVASEVKPCPEWQAQGSGVGFCLAEENPCAARV